MIMVKLYGKPDCSLCDLALAELEALAAEFRFAVEKVDITQDEQLFARFRYVIPVIEVEGTSLFAPISRRKLRQAVERASR